MILDLADAMKSLAMFLAIAIGAVAAIAATEDVIATKAVTVTGEVVRYEAGKAIVVRSLDGQDVTYGFAPTLVVPAEVGVGLRVTIVTEPSDTGALLITRITTEAGSGGVTTTTEKTPAAPAAEHIKSQMTSVSGTVTGYERGRSITLLRPNATTVTYLIDADSVVPSGLANGRKVVIRTITRPGVEQPVVRKVSYSKTTTKTKTVE